MGVFLTEGFDAYKDMVCGSISYGRLWCLQKYGLWNVMLVESCYGNVFERRTQWKLRQLWKYVVGMDGTE